MLRVLRIDLSDIENDAINAFAADAVAKAVAAANEANEPLASTPKPVEAAVKAHLLSLASAFLKPEPTDPIAEAAALEESGDLKGALEALKKAVAAKGKK